MEDRKLRYIYRITNLINGKTYIGKRTSQVDNVNCDNYWGSGNLIRLAEQKYGLENFKKEVLKYGFFTVEEINNLEEEFISAERTNGHGEYNIAKGGDGGQVFWGTGRDSYEKRMKQGSFLKRKLESMSLEERQKFQAEINEKAKQTKIKKGTFGKPTKGTTGYVFTDEQRQHVSESHTGEANGSFGKHWWTNGKETVKSELCPEGFWSGRDGSLPKEVKVRLSDEEKERLLQEKLLKKEALLEEVKKIREERLKIRKSKMQKYKCIETGEIGTRDFWRTKIKIGNLSRVVNTNWTINGLHFVTVENNGS